MRLRALRALLVATLALAVVASTASAITISPGGIHEIGGRASFNNTSFAFGCGLGLGFDTTAGTYAPGDVFAPLSSAGMSSCNNGVLASLETRPGELVTVGPLVVSPEQVVQAGGWGLSADGLVFAVMVVVVEPAVKGCGAFVA